jgi:hypothetical protein
MFIASRRTVLRTAVATLLGSPVLPRLAPAAQALSPQDALARQLQFTEDAATVDPRKAANFKADSRCDNCAFYVKAQAADGRAPCVTFGNRLVPEKGWCSVWIKAPR